jgi:hypothetical protein
MHVDAIQHTTNPTPSDSQASAVPDLSHVIVLRGNRLKCSVEDRHKYEPTVQKSHEEILTAE